MQGAQQNRFDLIVGVVRGHDVSRAPTLLQITQPRIARAPRFGFGCIGPEIQLDGFERESVALDVLSQTLRYFAALPLNSMIDMRHDQ